MLPQIVKDANKRFGERIAIENESSLTLTYKELDKISDEVTWGLSQKGLKEGSLLLLSIPSGIEYLLLYIAAAKLGIITAGINPRLKKTERLSITEASGPDLILATEDLTDGIPNDYKVEILYIAEDASTLLKSFRSSGHEPPELKQNVDRPVCICFTTGSTGLPKGALFTNSQLIAIKEMDTGGIWGGDGHLVPGTALPHVGSMTKIPWQIFSGTTFHLLDRWRPDSLLSLIEKHRISAVAGVSAQIALLLKTEKFDSYDLNCVKAIVAGGGPSSLSLVNRAQKKFNAPYSIRYSSTESGGIGLATPFNSSDEEDFSTIGKPRDGVKAQIRDQENRTLNTNEIGELWLKTPSAMNSYWNDPENTKKTLLNGWLKTGDLARIDEQGRYCLTGRTTEMYIRGGYNVYPQEVESVLSSHTDIEQLVIVPKPHPILGEIGVAFVVLSTPHASIGVDILKSYGREELADYKLPEEVVIMNKLPLNSGHKIDRKTLSEHNIFKTG